MSTPMLNTSLLITTLLLAPPPHGMRAPEPSAETYQTSLKEIARLDALINEGEDVGDELEEVIKQLQTQAPLLADDEVGQQLRTTALLDLARARVLAGHASEAAAAMDEAIRLAHHHTLEVADYGPALEALYEERRALRAQGEAGSLHVECMIPCSVYVDEQRTSTAVPDLSLGIHRVWIEPSAPESSGAAEIHRIELTAPEKVVRLTYAPAGSVPPAKLRPSSASQSPKRLLPLAGEGAIIFVGAALVIAGALTMGLDEDPGLAIGATLAGVGGATLIAGGTLMGVDQAAQREHERDIRAEGKTARLVVGWNFRF